MEVEGDGGKKRWRWKEMEVEGDGGGRRWRWKIDGEKRLESAEIPEKF